MKEDIDLENNQVVLFLKQQGGEATELRVFLSEGMDLDLDKDGVTDITISLQSLQESGITLSFEKSNTFIAQEQQLVEKRKGSGIVITFIVLFLVGLGVGLSFLIQKKRLSQEKKEEEENPKRYYKKE